MICFYHSKDLDGHCSGAIVRKKYPDCELYGIDYVDDFPAEKVRGQDVIMCDFSLQPFSRMISAAAETKSFLWIDHHSAAIKELEIYKKAYASVNIDKIKAVLDTKFAGCELTWKTLFPEEDMPLPVKLLGRYDVWDKTDPKVDVFQLGMKTYRTDPKLPHAMGLWDCLFLGSDDSPVVRSTLEAGEYIQQYTKMANEECAKTLAFEVDFCDLKCICMNRGGGSQLFDAVYNPERHDAMLTFVYHKSKQWTISLYTTKDDIDVSVIAKKYGGGGHRQAAGFQSKELPFLEFY